MARRRAGSLSSLRELNRLKVFEVVRERGAVSRAEIARHTGLAPSTVSNLVADLQQAGLVVQREAAPGPRESPSGTEDSLATDAAAVATGTPQGGRPGVLLSLNPAAGVVLGMHFDHQYVRVAVADVSFSILAERELQLDVDHEPAASLDTGAELVSSVLEVAGVERAHVLGAGVALAGPVLRSLGTVGASSMLPGWLGVDVETQLRERLGLPVHVDNDANLGALAESVLGAGRGASEMLYVLMSSGIGAGMILDGRLYRGANGTAGEIGHVLVDERGPICRCGSRGCLETFAGAGALVSLMRASYGDDVSFEQLIARARAGETGFTRAVSDAGAVVGRVLGSLCNHLNPGRIVVGGAFAAAGDVLLEPLRQSVARTAMPAVAQGLEIVPGELGARAELLGSLVLAVGQSDRAMSRRLKSLVGG